MRRVFISIMVIMAMWPLSSMGQAVGNYPPDDPTVVIDSTNLPIVWIEVDGNVIMRNTRIAARMKIIHNGEGRYNYGDTVAHPGQHVDYEGPIALRYRGNSSFYNSDKKPFSFRTLAEPLTPQVYDKKKVSILGMGKDNNWALLAPYSDRSMIRDILTFELARPWMEYTPDGRMCEVYLDGIYYGVYVLCELVTQGKHRLNLPDPGEQGEELTGGYIVEVGPNSEPCHRSNHHPINYYGREFTDSYIYFRYKFPDYEDMTLAQIKYINDQIDQMEDAYALPNYKDPEVGYRKYVDVESFIDFLLFSELGHNVDAYRQSTKLFKRRDSVDSRFKLVLWDFNLAYGNCNYNQGWRNDTWMYQQNALLHTRGETLVPFWWWKMWKDNSYVQQRIARWAQMRQGNLRSDRLMATIDSLAHVVTMGGAEARNSTAWPRWDTKLWPNYFFSRSYAAEIDYLKNWIAERVAWLDSRLEYTEPPLPPPPPPAIATGDVNGDGQVGIADINVLIDIVLGGRHDKDVMARADVNEDGEVNIADISALIDIILKS